jgi:hypothetical protein
MIEGTNKRPANSATVEVKGLPEGARSQPGHHAPVASLLNRERVGRNVNRHAIAD